MLRALEGIIRETVFMCGIVGCIGDRRATPILVESLKRLEYRGYDSAGIATLNGAEIDVTKIEGKICDLETIINETDNACVGIGHTRGLPTGSPPRLTHIHTLIVLAALPWFITVL